MTNQSILLLILVFCVASGLSFFQYLYPKKKRSVKNNFLFFTLRFLTYLILGILLVNPKIQNTTTEIVKRNLIVLVDNSSSITQLGNPDEVNLFINQIDDDPDLNQNFYVRKYKFGGDFLALDSLDFKDSQTNISQAFRAVEQIYDAKKDAIILITDGNQTLGQDYLSVAKRKNLKIYPVVVGDTVPALDSKIDLVNANTYSFLNNTFPIEVFVSYNANSTVNTVLQLFQNNSLIRTKQITFDQDNASQQIQFKVKANQIGLQSFQVKLKPIADEKFTTNNQYQFGVEVIDESSKVLIAASTLHPDLGMWKRSIETNKQREVEIKILGKDDINLDDYQVVIFYQPQSNFNSLIKKAQDKQMGIFTITGMNTDYDFLNTIQDTYYKSVSRSTEEYYPIYNSDFSNFQFDNLGFSNFPPLDDRFGNINLKGQTQTLLFQRVQGIETQSPLLFTYVTKNTKNAVLLGENSWRWRSQYFVQNQNFKDFDAFVSNLIQYLSTSENKERLIVQAENFYYQNDKSQVTAKFYDENYKLSAAANLRIEVTNEDTKNVQQFPMLFQNNKFVFNTTSLPVGNYSFAVVEKETQITKHGKFTILNYNIENQFVSPNIKALKSLSEVNKAFALSEIKSLSEKIQNNKELKPIQKSSTINESLIDWVFLLGFLMLTLFSEWFLRKYTGLI